MVPYLELFLCYSARRHRPLLANDVVSVTLSFHDFPWLKMT